MHFNPAFSMIYFNVLEEYILEFPFAIAVKYNEVAARLNFAAGKT